MSHCVLTYEMFMKLEEEDVWEEVATTAIMCERSHVLLSDKEYDGHISNYVKIVNYQDEYVEINLDADAEVVEVIIKKNGIPSSFNPLYREMPEIFAALADTFGSTKTIIRCDLPELNMFSLVWMFDWMGSPEKAIIVAKKINGASKPVQLRDILNKLCGGLLINVFTEYDDMFSYPASEEYNVPQEWYFDSNNTEWYSGTYRDGEIMHYCSPFIFGDFDEAGRGGMYEEIINHVDNLRQRDTEVW